MSGFGASNDVKKPDPKATTLAMHTSMMMIRKRPRVLALCASNGEPGAGGTACAGSSTTKPVAIAIAACCDHRLAGIPVMLRAKLSIAADFGKLASLPASSHGSCPIRARTETTLRVMPFVSVPTAAKRNSFSPERRKAKASWLGMLYSCEEMSRLSRISCAPVVNTTSPTPALATANGAESAPYATIQ